MVTIEESQQQAQQQRNIIEQRKKELEQQQRQLEEAKKRKEKTTFGYAERIKKQGLAGIRQRQIQKQQSGILTQQVSSGEKELDISKQQLSEAEKELSSYEEEIKKAQQQEKIYQDYLTQRQEERRGVENQINKLEERKQYLRGLVESTIAQAGGVIRKEDKSKIQSLEEDISEANKEQDILRSNISKIEEGYSSKDIISLAGQQATAKAMAVQEARYKAVKELKKLGITKIESDPIKQFELLPKEIITVKQIEPKSPVGRIAQIGGVLKISPTGELYESFDVIPSTKIDRGISKIMKEVSPVISKVGGFAITEEQKRRVPQYETIKILGVDTGIQNTLTGEIVGFKSEQQLRIEQAEMITKPTITSLTYFGEKTEPIREKVSSIKLPIYSGGEQLTIGKTIQITEKATTETAKGIVGKSGEGWGIITSWALRDTSNLQIYREQFGQVGKVVGGVGQYLIPGYGGYKGYLTLTSSLVPKSEQTVKEQASKLYEEQIKDIDTEKYEVPDRESSIREIESQIKKQERIGAGLSLATLGVIGGIKTTSYLLDPLVKQVPGGFKVTTRAKEILGTKIGEVSFVKGDSFLSSKLKFEYTPEPSKLGRYFVKVNIPSKTSNLQAAYGEQIGIDGGSRVLFGKQKLAQVGIEGKRTLVKDIGFFGKDEVLYSGVPYSQPKEYLKQLKYLSEGTTETSGFRLMSEQQARKVLRYTAPVTKEQSILKGVTKLTEEGSKGLFTYIETQPVRVVDSDLGIKTRAGKPKFETIFVKRKVVEGLEEAGSVIKEDSISLSGRYIKKGVIEVTNIDIKTGVSKVQAEEVKQVGVLELQKGKRIYDDFGVQKLKGLTISKYTPEGERKLFLDYSETTLLSGVKTDEPTGLVFKGGQGKKSSEEFIQSLYKKELVSAPKPTILKQEVSPQTKEIINKVEKIGQKLEGENIPSMVGGLGLKTLPAVGVALQFQEQIVSSQMDMSLKTKEGIETKQITQPTIQVSPLLRETIKENIILKEGIKESQVVKQPSLPKENIILKEGITSKLSPKLKLELKTLLTQKLTTGLKTPPKPAQTRPPQPKPRQPTSSIIKSSKKSTKKQMQTTGDEFNVFARRFGKDIQLGKTQTQKGAEELLTRKLRGSLAASGYIEKGGAKLKATELELGEEFTPSKLQEFRIIQKKEKRLSQRPEVSEIKMFKSKKGGKSKFGI